MINNNNIYKLIKKAKDENLNSSDPISKIIQHPITFIYSFTLNAQNEPILEENAEIPFKLIINQNNIKENNIKTESNINKNKINNAESINNDKFKKIEKEKTFLNKKRNFENDQKNNTKKNIQSNNNNPSKIVKNKIIHQIYNSKNINLWENESSEEKNDNILPIHKQIEFIDKSKEEFSKYKVEKKSEYDKDLDKGRLKKIHKNKISFKKHKNYFQKISKKKKKKQFKYNNNNNKNKNS